MMIGLGTGIPGINPPKQLNNGLSTFGVAPPFIQ
jgi:hypothetical protein